MTTTGRGSVDKSEEVRSWRRLKEKGKQKIAPMTFIDEAKKKQRRTIVPLRRVFGSPDTDPCAIGVISTKELEASPKQTISSYGRDTA